MRKALLALTALAVIAALAPVHADTRALSRTGAAAALTSYLSHHGLTT